MPDSKNSQIIISQKLGSEEEIIESFSAEIKSLFFKTKEVILANFFEMYPDQNVHQWSSAKEGTLGFGFGDRKMTDLFCYLKPIKSGYLNLGFFWASKLDDKDKILEGTGKNLRHVKIKNTGILETPALIDILKQSIRERFEFLNKKL